MKRNRTSTALSTAGVIMAMLLCSSVWAQESKQVWLANTPLFTVRSGAGGLTVAERVNALQLRANELLGERKTLPSITVRKLGMGSSIYVDNSLFTTVTPADAKSYGKTPTALATYWAQKMRTTLPKVRAQHNPKVENLSGSNWQVNIGNSQPYMRNNTLMLPFRKVMNSIKVPFVYDTTSRTIRANSSHARTQHTVGTRTVNVNGSNIQMMSTSQIINGTVYVPSKYIGLLTGKSVYWSKRNGILRVQ